MKSVESIGRRLCWGYCAACERSAHDADGREVHTTQRQSVEAVSLRPVRGSPRLSKRRGRELSSRVRSHAAAAALRDEPARLYSV
ncbi:unnamed protein product [Amoebophrya sp. A25]|nr:unnamed protein product [Amoebophrya sp. A25]|eukprot:GSA25T00011455001.1